MEKRYGPLVGFSGEKIKISRRGIRTPIDAKLEYVEGQNILTLSANIQFIVDENELEEPKLFYEAVLAGMKAWEGEYEVFGGQQLTVRVDLTTTSRFYDSIYVFPMTESLNNALVGMKDVFGDGEAGKRLTTFVENRRSMAALGFKRWSVHSRKLIYIFSRDDKFDNYEQIKHVAKHEFGHVLGLGDLYFSPSDGLNGVEEGKYEELDKYYIANKSYNLVMCDSYGPISNNDIEMVVLAFWQNKMQNYQVENGKNIKISEALGKGN